MTPQNGAHGGNIARSERQLQGCQFTIVWDRNGDRYHVGKGFRVIVDGVVAHRSVGPGKVAIEME